MCCSTDNLDFVKERATKTIFKLLAAKPEGEQVGLFLRRRLSQFISLSPSRQQEWRLQHEGHCGSHQA
jgi:hypothetical protein